MKTEMSKYLLGSSNKLNQHTPKSLKLNFIAIKLSGNLKNKEKNCHHIIKNILKILQKEYTVISHFIFSVKTKWIPLTYG